MVLYDAFEFDGIKSSDYGVYVLTARLNDKPEREVEPVSVPGRNGDLHIDMKRYTNVEVVYSCAIVEDAYDLYDSFLARLMASGTHRKLSDNIYPAYYRMGRFTGLVEPHMGYTRQLATFDLTFDCDPQRWLVEGQNAVPVTGGTTAKLINPTHYASKTLIKVSGTGTGTISFAPETGSSDTLTINSNPGNMIIDCDLQDIYNSSTMASYNSRVTFSGGDFPELLPGQNSILSASGLNLEIIPRWWTL